MFALPIISLIATCRVTALEDKPVIAIQGDVESPHDKYPGAKAFALTGPTTFGWRTGHLSADINIGVNAFVIDTGGGNETVLTGRISGSGTFEWRSGGVPQVAPSVIRADTGNPFTGTFTLSKGVLDIELPAGQNAFQGPLVVGGRDRAIVNLHANETLPDNQSVTFTGPKDTGLTLNGVTETIAGCTIRNHATLDFSGGSTLKLTARTPFTIPNGSTLSIVNYKPGASHFNVATSPDAETIGRIGFLDPAGLPRGLYRASTNSAGDIIPSERIQATNAPFPLTEQAYASRDKVYNIRGLDKLTVTNTPLPAGSTIAFFGDSLTWLGGYIAEIERALANSQSTARLATKLINRGINGGGVHQVLIGSPDAAYPGSSPQKAFATLIQEDKVTVAVVMIGINDVWWRKTSEADFRADLEKIVAAAAENHVRLVLCTMLGRGELPGGANPDDTKIDAYSSIIRDVAKRTGSTLVDVRAAAEAWWMNTNAALRPDGTLASKSQDILTYDGVHPNTRGNQLIASQIAAGIAQALRKK